MATTPRNNMVQDLSNKPPVQYPISSGGSFDINAGDLCWYDATVGYIKPLDSDAHANATFVGVAVDTSYTNPYGTKEYVASLGVWVGNVHSFFMTAGDTYIEGTPVYFGSDAQTVQMQSGSHAIGYAKMRKGVASVAYAAGATVDVLVVPNFPIVGA